MRVSRLGGLCLLLLSAQAACAPGAPPEEREGEAPPPALAEPAPSDAPTGVLRGMVTYMADAAGFSDCATGAFHPVAMEGDYLALERAYLDARRTPGEPVLVTVEGRVATMPAMEGDPVPTLVVERFLDASAGAGCGEGTVDRLLEGTEWVLVEVVGGVAVPPGVEPTLFLDGEPSTASGSTGCNGFQGSYELTGGRLKLGTPTVTLMACAGEAAALERDYLEALRVAGAFRLTGGELALVGESGPVARFRAR